MKRALFLLALAACSRGKKPPSCEQVCDHARDLAVAHLEETLRRISDHADDATDSTLRTRAADARTAEHARCLDRCAADELDRACIMQARSLDDANACLPTVRP